MEPDKNPPKESNPLFYFGNFYREKLSFDFIRLTQICEIALEPDGEVNEHTQICHEITLIVSGSGTFYTEDTALSVRQGDIHVVACGDRHRICASSSEKLRSICIGFSFDEEKTPDSYRFLEDFFAESPFFVREGGSELRCLIEMLIGEFYVFRMAHENAVEALLKLILLKVCRVFSDACDARAEKNPDRAVPSPDTVYKIVKYVDENIESVRTVREISQRLHYTESYVSTVFRRRMGVTLQSYIREKKLESAKMLLEYGNRTAAEVSEILHFECPQSFAKSFKRKYGVTPHRFVSKQKDKSNSSSERNNT